MSAATTTAAANTELVNQKLADFMSNQKKGKKRSRTSASEAAAAAVGQDVVANAAAGRVMPETQASTLSDHHFSKIDETKIVLGLDKRKNKSAKMAAKATADDKMVTFIRNAQGAQTLLKVEIAPFVLGVTSLLNNEGTYGKTKEKKEYENARGDCYFLAIMWAGQLEGRANDPALTDEQQACLKKMYRISRQIMRLMFDEAPWAKFRSQAIDWARADMKIDYIEASPKHRGNNRAPLSETDFDAIEKANPDLMEKMLLHAREDYFLKKANQFPGKPSEQEEAAGAKCAQMFSMRQKCYYIQEGKFDPLVDKGKKFDPLPGVICNEKTWPDIYRVMTGVGPKDGHRVYNPIQYFNGVNGAAMIRPTKTILVDAVDDEGRPVTRQLKIPDATWNPMMEKVESRIANGKIVEQKLVKINSLVACVVKFEPYAGPEQWGVRVVMNGTMSHMDHVLWTPDVVVRQDKWARAYNHDDIIEIEVPKTAAEVAVEAKQKSDKAKEVAATAATTTTAQNGGNDESSSYESDDDDNDVTGNVNGQTSHVAAQQDIVVRAPPKTHTPATLTSRVDDDDDDPVLAASKAKLASVTAAAKAAAAAAAAAATIVVQSDAGDGKKRKRDKHQTQVSEVPSNGAAAIVVADNGDDDEYQQKAKKSKETTTAVAAAAEAAPIAAEPDTSARKLKKRSKRDEDSGDDVPLQAVTKVAAAATQQPDDDEGDTDEDDEESSEEAPPPPPVTKKIKNRAGHGKSETVVMRTGVSDD